MYIGFMKLSCHRWLAALLALAVLAGTPGIAACLTCASAVGAHMPCCGSRGDTASVRTVSCCRDQASVPSEPSRAVAPAAAPVPAVAATQADFSAAPVSPLRTAELPPVPPPLRHEGIGLYTLNSVFLI
ncbi:MAG: hypothetical protein DMF53_15360 [Acidobacteria bacterium]|nr:MAG: hypothetical protein DMF53_15360 [Acidobacteriota bacterium]